MGRKKKDTSQDVEYRVNSPKTDTKSLEGIIEDKLRKILVSDLDPDKNTLTAINTAIKFVAVQHKINEASWGEKFLGITDDDDDDAEKEDGRTDGDDGKTG